MTDQSAPTLEGLQRQILELHIANIQKAIIDHEERIRTLEDTATRFNFILYLTMGGGLLSLINLMGILAVIGLYLFGKAP